MNHNAYTVVAIEGTHFCNAARIVRSSIKYILYLKSRKKKKKIDVILLIE